MEMGNERRDGLDLFNSEKLKAEAESKVGHYRKQRFTKRVKMFGKCLVGTVIIGAVIFSNQIRDSYLVWKIKRENEHTRQAYEESIQRVTPLVEMYDGKPGLSYSDGLEFVDRLAREMRDPLNPSMKYHQMRKLWGKNGTALENNLRQSLKNVEERDLNLDNLLSSLVSYTFNFKDSDGEYIIIDPRGDYVYIDPILGPILQKSNVSDNVKNARSKNSSIEYVTDAIGVVASSYGKSE